MARPQPDHHATRAEFRWALRNRKRRHGGSLLAVLAIALVFGGLSGSQTVLWAFLALAVLGWTIARSRP